MSELRIRSLSAAVLAAAAMAAIPSVAEAQGMPKVRPPSPAHMAAARSLFDRGLVVLMESTPRGDFAQVSLFGRVNAPQKLVYDVLADPDQLPPMQPPMREIEVRARKGNAVTYRWRYDGTLIDIRGTTSMALAPPAAVMWIFGEGFGPGQILWRLYPAGDQTDVSVTLNVDVTRSSHTILRWLSKANRHQRESWNVGYGIVSLRGLQAVASQRAGRKGFPPPSGKSGHGPLRPLTQAQVKALGPLLARGMAGVIEQDRQGRVAQTALAIPVKAPPQKLQGLFSNPGSWGSPVKGVSFNIPDGDTSGENVEFAFSFPAFSIRTDMALKQQPAGVDITSPSGSLKGSLINFGTTTGTKGTVLTGAARFRPRQANFILRRMIDTDPYFGHALNASVLAIWMRAFRTGAERR